MKYILVGAGLLGALIVVGFVFMAMVTSPEESAVVITEPVVVPVSTTTEIITPPVMNENTPPTEMDNNDMDESVDTSDQAVMMEFEAKSWTWVSASLNDESEIVPTKPGVFTLTFKDGGVSVRTDCNNAGGQFTAADGRLSFEAMMSTMMYCEGSQEGEFLQLLSNVDTYDFSSDEALILGLKFDSGTIRFE